MGEGSGEARAEGRVAVPHVLVPLNVSAENDRFAIVDEEDQDLRSHVWTSWKHRKTFYAAAVISGKRQLLHRVIAIRMGMDSSFQVDHRNRNGLDCRRSNIRRATNSQNAANRAKTIRNSSGYKGVGSRELASGGRSYSAQIEKNGKTYHLGTFSTAKRAAHAYDQAAVKLFGLYARTNLRSKEQESLRGLKKYLTMKRSGDSLSSRRQSPATGSG